MRLGEALHVVEGVLEMALGIVRADRGKADAFRHQHLGQWLQMKTTTVALVPATSFSAYVFPSVAGKRNSGAVVPRTVDAAVAAMALTPQD